MRLFILNGGNLIYRDTNLVEFAGNKSRIGIYDLANEDLIANGNNFSKH